MRVIQLRPSPVLMQEPKTSTKPLDASRELVEEARAEKRKVICFVTGVPGAGKTLVGLNVATAAARLRPIFPCRVSFRKRSPCGSAS